MATVSDGLAAVATAARLEPDLLVLDIAMRGLNGIAAAARLKESGSTAKVVFVTNLHDRDELLFGAECAPLFVWNRRGKIRFAVTHWKPVHPGARWVKGGEIGSTKDGPADNAGYETSQSANRSPHVQ